MQKKLLTVAVAGLFAAPVAAMADVTVYGTIDTGVRQISKLSNGDGTSDSVLDIANNTRTTNRWGLKGSEDLGGGLRANFTLEGQYGSDNGALGSGATSGLATSTTTSGTTSINANQGLFQRKAIVGLSGAAWHVDFGRDYTVNFKAQGIYDPMSYTYTGIVPAATHAVAGTRSSNMATGGFRWGTGGVTFDYAAGEVQGQNSWGTRTGAMVDLAFGPVKVAAAYSTQKGSTAATSGDKTNTTNLGAAYGLGAFTIRGGYAQEEQKKAAGTTKLPLLMVGVQYNFSPTMSGRLGYYSEKKKPPTGGDTKQSWMIAGLDYNLSKTTVLYAEVDRYSADDAVSTATLNDPFKKGAVTDGSTGIGVGIMHAF